MNALDWVLIAMFILGLLRGLWRGAISQLFGIVGLLGGFLLAMHSYEAVSAQVRRVFSNLPQAELICFIVIFLLTWFTMSILGYWLSSLFHRTGMGCLDRFLGGAMGLGKAFVMAVVLISSLTVLMPSDSPILSESRFAPYVQEVARLLIKATPPSVQEHFERKRRELWRYWHERSKPNRTNTPQKSKGI